MKSAAPLVGMPKMGEVVLEKTGKAPRKLSVLAEDRNEFLRISWHVCPEKFLVKSLSGDFCEVLSSSPVADVEPTWDETAKSLVKLAGRD